MQRIGKNIFSLGISRVVSGAIIFLVHARLANYLGAENFGRFALILAFYTIFLLMVDIGMSKYVIKKVSEDRSLASRYLGNFFGCRAVCFFGCVTAVHSHSESFRL